MSERVYNKLVLYANILQKIGVINEKEKSEILHTINKKSLWIKGFLFCIAGNINLLQYYHYQWEYCSVYKIRRYYVEKKLDEGSSSSRNINNSFCYVFYSSFSSDTNRKDLNTPITKEELLQVKDLLLNTNETRDYSALKYMSNLKSLTVANAKIKDPSFFTNLKQIEKYVILSLEE